MKTGMKLVEQIPFASLEKMGFIKEGGYYKKDDLLICANTREVKAQKTSVIFFKTFANISKTRLIASVDSFKISGMEVKGYHGPISGMPKHLKDFVKEQGIENVEKMLFDIDEYVSFDLRNYWEK